MKSLLTTLTIVLCASTFAAAQAGTGAKFGTRDPHTCASKKEPTSGAPSGARLEELVRCGSGGEKVYDGQLFLLENLKAEIGKGRPYQASDSLAHNIDPSQPVYPIRGSFDKYQCDEIKPALKMKGRNAG